MAVAECRSVTVAPIEAPVVAVSGLMTSGMGRRRAAVAAREPGSGASGRAGEVRTPDTFFWWLDAEQHRRGFQDAAWARLLGVSTGQLSNLRAGRRLLSRQLVERVCCEIPGAREAYVQRCLFGGRGGPGRPRSARARSAPT